jgi:predicted nucleic acid-binding Zn ribbon protein
VLCSKCSSSIDDDAQVCRDCGAPVDARTIAIAVATPPSACKKCGAALPEGSLFCLKCGRPVDPEPDHVLTATTRVEIAALPPRKRKRRNRPVTILFLALILIGIICWAVFSDDEVAQQFRDYVTGARAETIVETPFSIKPRSFSAYKFAVPPGAISVTVTGPFDVSGNSDNNVEAYVLTESAFAIWQSGYSTSTHYESGRVAQGTINAKLPSGAGNYYLVFNNNFSPRTAKAVHATVTLQYETWAPDWLLRLKEKIWNWIGLN